METNDRILKKVLSQGNYSLSYKIIPYVCSSLSIFNIASIIIDNSIASYTFPLLRISLAVLCFVSTIYFFKMRKDKIYSKLFYEMVIAIVLPLSFSLFMFLNYSSWYFYCIIFWGGLLYGLVSGHFAIPLLSFPVMYYLGYLISVHIFGITDSEIFQKSLGVFIVIWFSVICTTIARIGFDIFYLLNISLQEQRLQFTNIEELKNAEAQKQIIENEINKLKEIETVGKFAGGIAHDFNNMLTVITGQMMYLKRFANEEWEKEKIEIVMQSVKKTSGLIKNLLRFAQKNETDLSLLSINECVLSVLELINSASQKIIIETDIVSENLTISANTNILNTALINLFLTAASIAQEHILTISLGITEEHHPKEQKAGIHNEFAITKYAAIRVGCKNSGVIENIVKSECKAYTDVLSMLKKLNGHLTKEISCRYGNITLNFPLIEKDNDENGNASVSDKKNLQIMVVDDDLLVLKSIEETLSADRYRVKAFSDGYSALQFFKEEHKDIDLVILDMSMPELSGKELFNRMKNIHIQVKVLIITGYFSDTDIAEMIHNGASALLEKPFTDEELFSKIESILKTPQEL